jgi:branched-chain amino acid transport system ATP-binding protein
MTLLKIKGLGVRYGGIDALAGVSMEVQEGETVLLVGANGAGKSSLLKAVIGLVSPSSGSIHYLGKDLNRISCASRAQNGIGYSPEGRRLFGSLTVTENILSSTLSLDRAKARENLELIQKTFPLLAERANQPANQLSGGQQQVVAIARAVGTMPKLLLLDEPFLGLAPVWIEKISEGITKLKRRGMTILMTEQMARPALKLADRAYVMRGGVVRQSGSADEIREIALAEEYL